MPVGDATVNFKISTGTSVCRVGTLRGVPLDEAEAFPRFSNEIMLSLDCWISTIIICVQLLSVQ